MNNSPVLITTIVSGILIGAALFFFTGEEDPAPRVIDQPVVREIPMTPPPAVAEPVEPEPESVPAPLPEEAEPEVVIENTAPAVTEPEALVLPGLNDSDDFVQSQVEELENATAIKRQMNGMQIIRKFVVLVDGMSRGDIPERDLPVMPPQATLTVNAQGEEFFRLDPASYTRFNMLVNTFVATPSEQIVANYQLLAPLVEEAFAELGYPGRSFDTVLRQAIDNILDAEVPTRSILLTQPSVNYRFADPQLESLSELEKLLIRMGPENAAKVQRKVQELDALMAD